MHLAAEHDHSEVVKLFLKHKPDLLSVPNKNGYTCAHIAAAKGSVAVIKELMRLNQESVINARISVRILFYIKIIFKKKLFLRKPNQQHCI